MTGRSQDQPLPHRRAVGGDLYLTTDPARPDVLSIDCGFVIPHWKPRPPALPGRPAFPGTAVLTEDRWWEIRSKHQPSADARVVYELAPWPENHPIRAPHELTADAAEKITVDYLAQKRREKGSTYAGLMILLIGLLPGDEQKRLELEYGIRPALGTLLTALFLGSASIASLLLIVAMLRGLPMSPALKSYTQAASHVFPVFVYLVLESLLRINGALNDHPMGCFLVAGPYSLVQNLFRRRSASRTQQLPAAALAVRGPESEWMSAVDQVVEVPSEDERHRLEIHSRLPKDHWRANIHGIDWNGRRYVLEERFERPESPLPYGFRLTEADDQTLFRDIHVYDPAEVREVYRAQKRLSVGSRVKTFGLLWGFTSPQLQDALAEIYGYEPWRNTRGSIVFSLFSALLMLGTFITRVNSGNAVLGDGLIAIFFVALTWDSVVRMAKLQQGELSEGLLGPAFAPFVRPALRWRASPDWRYPDVG